MDRTCTPTTGEQQFLWIEDDVLFEEFMSLEMMLQNL